MSALLEKPSPKRYWLFSYDEYYPAGGMCDFEDSFDSMEEAVLAKRSIDADWDFLETVDTLTGKILRSC